MFYSSDNFFDQNNFEYGSFYSDAVDLDPLHHPCSSLPRPNSQNTLFQGLKLAVFFFFFEITILKDVI